MSQGKRLTISNMKTNNKKNKRCVTKTHHIELFIIQREKRKEWVTEDIVMINLHSHIPSNNSTLDFGQVHLKPEGFAFVSWHSWHGAFVHAEEPIDQWQEHIWTCRFFYFEKKKKKTLGGWKKKGIHVVKDVWNLISKIIILKNANTLRTSILNKQMKWQQTEQRTSIGLHGLLFI